VQLRHGGDGDRVELALEDQLSAEDVETIAAKLDKLDAKRAWTQKTLAIISERPRVAASQLAAALGYKDKLEFKEEVRKLKKQPVIYMVSHMMVMPLIDLYATACDWAPAGIAGHQGFVLTLGGFLLLSLVNGTSIEIARKSWAPEQEREGVETYSKLWKPGGAGVALMAVFLVGFAVSAFVNVRSGAGVWFLYGLIASTAWAAWTAIDYAGSPTPRTAKAVELSSGIYVLANYLLLGVLPLIESLFR
jgi:hypothetical protein